MTTKARNRRPRRPATDNRPELAPTRALVDLRHPLPTRPARQHGGPYTAAEITEARAALAATTHRLPIPVAAWHALPYGQAAAHLDDSTVLAHSPEAAWPFTLHAVCTHGAWHTRPVRNRTDLHAAIAAAGHCPTTHADLTDWDQADGEDTQTLVTPLHDKPQEH